MLCFYPTDLEWKRNEQQEKKKKKKIWLVSKRICNFWILTKFEKETAISNFESRRVRAKGRENDTCSFEQFELNE